MAVVAAVGVAEKAAVAFLPGVRLLGAQVRPSPGQMCGETALLHACAAPWALAWVVPVHQQQRT